MGDHQRRLLPDDRWDMGAVEAWLEERAARGWILVKCGGWFATFERAEPRSCRVRLDIAGSRTQSRQEEVDEAYREMGWRRIAPLGGDYLAYCCFDPSAPEFQTDPVAEGWLREKALKKTRRDLIGSWVFLLACIAFAVWHYLRAEAPVEDFLYGSGAAAALIPLFFPLLVLATVRSLRGIRDLRRQIAAGLPNAHTGDWKKRRRSAMTGLAVLMAFYLLLGYPIWQMNAGWGGDLDEADRPLPYVAASTLDPFLDEGSRTWDSCIMNVSFLAPEYYTIWEEWSEGAKTVTTYDRLRFSAFARPLYEERLANVLEAWPEAVSTPLDHPGFDEAVLVTVGENTFLEAYRGKAVLHAGAFRVSGLEDHLDAYAALLAEFP